MKTATSEPANVTSESADHKANLPAYHDTLRALMVKALIRYHFVPEMKELDFDDVDGLTSLLVIQKLLPLIGKHNRLEQDHQLACLQLIHNIASAYPKTHSDIDRLAQQYHKLAEMLDIKYDFIAPACLPKNCVASLKEKALFTASMHKNTTELNQQLPIELQESLAKLQFAQPQQRPFAMHANVKLEGELYPAEAIIAVVLRKIIKTQEDDQSRLHYAHILAGALNDQVTFEQLKEQGSSVNGIEKGLQTSFMKFLLNRVNNPDTQRKSLIK